SASIFSESGAFSRPIGEMVSASQPASAIAATIATDASSVRAKGRFKPDTPRSRRALSPQWLPITLSPQWLPIRCGICKAVQLIPAYRKPHGTQKKSAKPLTGITAHGQELFATLLTYRLVVESPQLRKSIGDGFSRQGDGGLRVPVGPSGWLRHHSVDH